MTEAVIEELEKEFAQEKPEKTDQCVCITNLRANRTRCPQKAVARMKTICLACGAIRSSPMCQQHIQVLFNGDLLCGPCYASRQHRYLQALPHEV